MRLLAWALLLAGVFPAAVRAQPAPPPPPASFFTDTASVVPVDIAAQLEARLRDFERTSSNQILVVVQNRMPEGYASVEEYANRTAQAWRVGDASRDNGAVLFVFVVDRTMRLEVGYGLEGALPDALALRIIEDEITPRFREGQYGAGLLAGVDAIFLATRGEYQPRSAAMSTSQKLLLGLAVMFFALIGVLIPIWREIRSIRAQRPSSEGDASGGATPSSAGGWSADTARSVHSGSSSSSGSSPGWGGFTGGGGSFGGGGASGRW